MAARFGRRMGRGVAGTAIAAAAMAALSASQAPGLAAGAVHRATEPAPPGTPIDGDSRSPYITALPPLNSPVKPGSPGVGTGTGGLGPVTGGTGIPAIVLRAYQQAEATLAKSNPGCHLPWQLLAAIGQVESGQADRGNVDANGTTLTPILGPLLNGTNGYATIKGSGGGYARAMGPMQFIPSTWANWAADGNGDGVQDPNNVFDAALAAGRYLCAAGGDLSNPVNMKRAILGYNDSTDYLNTVLSWYAYFRDGGAKVIPGSGGTPAIGGGTPGGRPSASASPSASGSPGGGQSASPSHSPRPTVSASGSIGPGPSTSPSASSSPSGSPSPSGSGTPSGSPTGCPTTSPSPTPSPSGSATATASPSPSASATASPTGSATPSPSPSGSSPAPSGTPCPTTTG